jgi:hypothetical protein
VTPILDEEDLKTRQASITYYRNVRTPPRYEASTAKPTRRTGISGKQSETTQAKCHRSACVYYHRVCERRNVGLRHTATGGQRQTATGIATDAYKTPVISQVKQDLFPTRTLDP